MAAVEMRRLLAPAPALTLTRPGILNTTWKPLTSATACCSSAGSADDLSALIIAPAEHVAGRIIHRRARRRWPRQRRILHDQRMQLGRPATARAPHGGDAERHIRPVLPRALSDFGSAHQFERRLAVLRAGVEAGIIERRPARRAHGIGHPQRRLGRGSGRKIDPHLQLAGRLDRAIGFEPGNLPIDLALLAFRIANGESAAATSS